MTRIVKRIVMLLAAVAAAILIALAFRPKPVQVETGRAVKGPLQITVDEDGETRAHDRFTLAAPIAGRLSRIELHEGDEVGPGTVIATISPLPLDAREAAEIRARIQAAEARKREAEQQLARWENDQAQAQRDLNRARALAKDRIIAQQEFEQAESKQVSTTKEVEAAKSRVQSAAADVEREKAGLISLEAQQNQASKLVALRPAARARILRILEKSERVVPYGTPIVVLSNPNKIEIVVDLLSTDAVKVKPGAPVIIENWGGPKPLRARVRTVEPYGFTKVSALGIEEQRANVIADFVDPPDRPRRRLPHRRPRRDLGKPQRPEDPRQRPLPRGTGMERLRGRQRSRPPPPRRSRPPQRLRSGNHQGPYRRSGSHPASSERSQGRRPRDSPP